MSWLQRKLEDWSLPLRLFFGHKYIYYDKRKVVRTWPNRLIKGPVHESEYEALIYLTEHTNVPDGLYIEREFWRGNTLDDIWNDRSIDERRSYVEAIWQQLKELRMHSPPADLGNVAVGSITGGSVKDDTISLSPIGPYTSLGDFENTLKDTPEELGFPASWDTDEELRKIVLTNSDIAPWNILVRSEGQPGEVVLFDWDFGGWWPAYWERVKWHVAEFEPGEFESFVELMDEVSGISDAQ